MIPEPLRCALVDSDPLAQTGSKGWVILQAKTCAGCPVLWGEGGCVLGHHGSLVCQFLSPGLRLLWVLQARLTASHFHPHPFRSVIPLRLSLATFLLLAVKDCTNA